MSSKTKRIVILIVFLTAILIGVVFVLTNNNSQKQMQEGTGLDSGSVEAKDTTMESSMISDSEMPLTYISITMAEAEEIFKTPGDYIILDVRRDDEYSEGHIPGAINIANEDIDTINKPEMLPDLNQVIYVYCRSGRRSKEASEKLVQLGYTNIIEFGGIIDWNGEVEK